MFSRPTELAVIHPLFNSSLRLREAIPAILFLLTITAVALFVIRPSGIAVSCRPAFAHSDARTEVRGSDFRLIFRCQQKNGRTLKVRPNLFARVV
jgi:hypothetical protein